MHASTSVPAAAQGERLATFAQAVSSGDSVLPPQATRRARKNGTVQGGLGVVIAIEYQWGAKFGETANGSLRAATIPVKLETLWERASWTGRVAESPLSLP